MSIVLLARDPGLSISTMSRAPNGYDDVSTATRERGFEVGRNISIVGYGNSSAAAFSDPPLTTIDHAVFENGRHIGQSLLRLLRGDAKPADIHYLEARRCGYAAPAPASAGSCSRTASAKSPAAHRRASRPDRARR
jgi:DNA-binding LacI/PurR family transcriptional regulator